MCPLFRGSTVSACVTVCVFVFLIYNYYKEFAVIVLNISVLELIMLLDLCQNRYIHENRVDNLPTMDKLFVKIITCGFGWLVPLMVWGVGGGVVMEREGGSLAPAGGKGKSQRQGKNGKHTS